MYSMPGNWSDRQIQRIVGPQVEHPLATTERRVAWENSSLRVECNQVRNVTTLEDQLAVRITPASEPYYAAVVVPVAPDTRLHLVGRYRYPIGQWSVEFPRFDLDSGDSGWKDAAEADLFRLAGLTADRMTLLGAVQIDPALLATSAIVILAEGCQSAVKGPKLRVQTPDSETADDHDELVAGSVALPLDELSDLVRRGEVACGLTLAAMALYRARLG